jgi:hypothetical protein
MSWILLYDKRDMTIGSFVWERGSKRMIGFYGDGRKEEEEDDEVR